MSGPNDSHDSGTSNPGAQMAEATELIKAKRLNEAQKICERLVEADGDDVGALYALGWIALCHQDVEFALSYFGRVVELKPAHARAHYNLGTILMNREEMDAAGVHFQAAIAVEPNFTEALVNLGSIRSFEGNWDAARAACEKAFELEPHNPDVLFNLGQVLHNQKDSKEAEALLTKALQFRPDSVEFMALLSHIMRCRGAFDAGEELLQMAISHAPKNHQSLVALGNFYRETQKREKALEAYISAFNVSPTSVNALSALSHYTAKESGLDLYRAIGKAREAIGPQDASSRLDLGFAMARTLDKAQEYEKAWLEATKANADYRCHHKLDTAPRTKFAKGPAPSLENAHDQYKIGLPPLADQPQFIIIVGMQGSGKSTTEKLMGNVPGVKHGYESNILFETMKNFNQLVGFDATEDANYSRGKLTSEFQRIFQEKLADRVGQCAAYTVTVPAISMLNNIPNLIKIMPNALIVFVDRDIWDNAMRIFLCNYKLGEYSFSYRLSSIMKQIQLWRSTMDWWLKTEPKRFLNIKYEDLVADPHSVLSSICSFSHLLVPSAPHTPIFDDRGCGVPYRQMMETQLRAEGDD